MLIYYYGVLLMHLGRHNEAIREGRSAVQLDPLSSATAQLWAGSSTGRADMRKLYRVGNGRLNWSLGVAANHRWVMYTRKWAGR